MERGSNQSSQCIGQSEGYIHVDRGHPYSPTLGNLFNDIIDKKTKSSHQYPKN